MARPDEIKLADELRELANAIDPPQFIVMLETRKAAAEAMRAAADAMQYGNCNYWCPACYADVSDPTHRTGAPPVSQASDGARNEGWLVMEPHDMEAEQHDWHSTLARAAFQPQHQLDALLPEICQLIDTAREDFTQRGLWTEWDQSVRDRITAYNLSRASSAVPSGVSVPAGQVKSGEPLMVPPFLKSKDGT